MQKSFFFFQSPQSTALQQPHACKAQSKAKRGSAHDIADMVHAGQHTANTDGTVMPTIAQPAFG